MRYIPMRYIPMRYISIRYLSTVTLVAVWPQQWLIYRDLIFQNSYCVINYCPPRPPQVGGILARMLETRLCVKSDSVLLKLASCRRFHCYCVSIQVCSPCEDLTTYARQHYSCFTGSTSEGEQINCALIP